MKKNLFLFALLSLFFMQGVMAQTTLTGTVIDSNGEAMFGVTVAAKEAAGVGTITDIDGKYTLNLPDGVKTIVFSSVGYETIEKPFSGQSIIDATLKMGSVNLETTVVTAIGIKKEEKSLGYSATQVKNDELTKARGSSVVNSLQGKVSGVSISSASGSPGASSKVILRGMSSISGNNQPLYVVDGVPINNEVVNSTSLNGGLDFGNRANDINPDDVESMSILKGSSGTALYGSRAANGVIIITTKKGSSNKNGQAKIVVNSSVTFSSPLMFPTFQNDYGQGFYSKPNITENTSWGPRFDNKVRLWGQVIDGYQQYKPYQAQKNNIKDFFDVGQNFNNSISLSGGNEKGTYYVSYSNIYADGIFPTDADKYNRHTFALRGSYKLNERLTSSSSFNYIKKNSSFVPTGQDQAVMDNLLQTPRDISIVDHENINSRFSSLPGYFNGYAINPYYVLKEHGNDANEDRIFGKLDFNLKIADGISASWRLGTDISNTDLKQWRAITKGYLSNSDEIGRVTQNNYSTNEINSDFVLNISKKINEDLSLDVLFGHNVNMQEYKTKSMSVNGLDIPYFYDLSNSSGKPTINEYKREKRIIGVFSSVDIGYKGMLYLSIAARNDWSSSLPKKNNSFFYPSVNLSFVLSEAFPGLAKYMPYGKIRAGWAQTGNDAAPYQVFSTFAQGNHRDGYRELTYPLNGAINGFEKGNLIGNPELQPEISTEFEIGGDFRFFDNRLGLDISYYNKTITDLILATDLAYSTGFSAQTLNIGQITNKGIELLLTVTPIKTKDFKWDLSFNFTKNDNKVDKLAEGLTEVSIGGLSSTPLVAMPGHPLSVIKGDAVARDPQGRMIVNEKGLPIKSTKQVIYGNTQNDYIAGFGTALSYKGLSLSATLDIRKGGIMYSRTASLMSFSGTATTTTFNERQPFIIPNSVIEVTDATTGKITYEENTTPIAAAENLHTYWGSSYGGGLYDKRFVIDKSFVKLREVTLSYSLPNSLLKKSPFSAVQLSVIGTNLIIWLPDSNEYVDPESTTFGNDIEGDFGEYGASPTVRSIGGSVKLTF